jgi:hypothetical protein
VSALQFPGRVSEILFARDVVAIEDRACLVARDFHRDGLGNARTIQVPDGCAAKILPQPARTSRRPTGLVKAFPEAQDGLPATAAEQLRRDDVFLRQRLVTSPQYLDRIPDFGQFAIGEHAAFPVLRGPRLESDDARLSVHQPASVEPRP